MPTVLMIEQGGRGGVADYTEQLATALAAGGTRVAIVTAKDHRFGPMPEGVEVLPWFTYFRGGSPLRDLVRRFKGQKVVNGLRFVALTLRLLPRARGGVVHLQGHEVPALDTFQLGLLRLVGARVVQTPHNTFGRGGSRRFVRAMLRMPHAIVVHTTWDVSQLPAEVRGKAHVIPHGDYGPLARRAAPVARADARAALGLPADAPVVLCFGQLRADKGLEDVLRAAALVPELHVVLAGEDSGGLAGCAGLLTERVLVREGFQSMAAAAELFAACDAAVLAYRQASMSGVLLLAYGFGVPVVAYPVGGLPEAVRDGETGWLTARADVEALAATFRELVAAGPAEAERRGAAGRAFAAREYDWVRIATLTRALYES